MRTPEPKLILEFVFIFWQLINFFSGKLSSLDDLKDIPFPVKYYTLSAQDLHDNDYPISLPGWLLFSVSTFHFLL